MRKVVVVFMELEENGSEYPEDTRDGAEESGNCMPVSVLRNLTSSIYTHSPSAAGKCDMTVPIL